MAHLACRVSDDDGRSWGSEVLLPMKRRSIDHPDPNIPVAWLGWRQVEWDAQGRALFPFTRFDSKLASEERPKEWCQSEVIRFENIAEGPDPSDLQITWLPEGKGEALDCTFQYARVEMGERVESDSASRRSYIYR